MSIPRIVGSRLAGTADQKLLVVGPSLGTSVTALWSAVAGRLAHSYHVVGWDLPGHGKSPPPVDAFSISELAEGIVDLVDTSFGGGLFVYAGVSVAGAVGLQLALDHPKRIVAAALLCTGAKIGDPADWLSRARAVREAGTAHLVTLAVQRWFAPGFVERDPATHAALLEALRGVDDTGYAQTCEALAAFDVRDQLHDIHTPVLAVAGANDIATPPELLRFVSDGVKHGRYTEVPNAAHLAPAEQPDRIANLMTEFMKGRVDDR